MTTDENRQPPRAGETRILLVLLLLVGLVGAAGFAGWLTHGDNLFWSMLQAGLAWCM